jgi:hypothetical protein
MISGIIQVFVAIAIVIIMFVIAFSVYNMEFVKAIQNFGKIRTETNVFVGIKDLNIAKHERYNTIDSSLPSYLAIKPSINSSGGTEYSYNFWLYLDPKPGNKTTNAFAPPTVAPQITDGGIETLLKQNGSGNFSLNDNPVILFMKGSTVMYNYNTLCNKSTRKSIKTDVLIKAPLVKLEQGCDKLTVEFNTYASPDGVVEGTRDTCGENNTSWDYMNAYKIGIEGLNANTMYEKLWFMVTIVIQDTLPSDPSSIRNKIHAMIYVNGVSQFDRYIDGTLTNQASDPATINKITNADFYVNPEISTKGTSIYINQNSPNAVQRLPETVQVDYSNPNYSIDQPKSIMMSDLSYFNYALDGDAITGLFNAGITKQYAPNYLSTSTNNDNDFMKKLSYATNNPTLNEIGVDNN